MIQGDTTVTRFNPRSPCGERRRSSRPISRSSNFNPRPLAGSDEPEAAGVLRQLVSTHAPLAGSDYSTTLQGCRVTSVSTHAPLAGSDCVQCTPPTMTRFQPTLPLRGATTSRRRTPRACAVSTHAPLAGSDQNGSKPYAPRVRFQPTLPLRGATAAALTTNFIPSRFQPTLPLRGATRRWQTLCSVLG